MDTTITATKVQTISKTAKEIIAEIENTPFNLLRVEYDSTYTASSNECVTDSFSINFDYVVYAKEETNWIDNNIESVDLTPTYVEISITGVSTSDLEYDITLSETEKQLIEKTIKNKIL